MYVLPLTLLLAIFSLVLINRGITKKEELTQLENTSAEVTKKANESKAFSDEMHGYFKASSEIKPQKVDQRLFEIHTVFKENFKNYGIELTGGFNFGNENNTSNQKGLVLTDISQSVNKTNLKQVRLNLKGQYSSLALFNRFWSDVVPQGVALESLTIKEQAFDAVLVIYGI